MPSASIQANCCVQKPQSSRPNIYTTGCWTAVSTASVIWAATLPSPNCQPNVNTPIHTHKLQANILNIEKRDFGTIPYMSLPDYVAAAVISSRRWYLASRSLAVGAPALSPNAFV